MKYTFTFKEINYGSIEIESDHMPDRSEAIDAIMNGSAFIGGTEYEDIQLEGDIGLNRDASETAIKETTQGYKIKRDVMFENNRGFALAESPTAPDPFVTWQFTEHEDGKRDYYWGHYKASMKTAVMDFENRIAGYFHDHGFSETDAYRYYSTQRPVDIGTFPKTENGPIRIENFDKREDVEQGKFLAWGYLVYDAPLSAKQIYDYELRPAHGNFDYIIAKNKELAVMREQAQVVGHWEDMKGLPDDERFTWHKPSINAYELRDPVVSPEQIEQRYHRAMRDFAREEKRTSPKPIMEQLAEAAKQVERGTVAPARSENKSHEDR